MEMQNYSQGRSRGRRIRLRLTGLVLVGIVGLVLIVSPLWALVSDHLSSPQIMVKVSVQHGDTLWNIAKAHGPRDADPRRTMDRICRVNGIRGSMIHPGQQIVVPLD